MRQNVLQDDGVSNIVLLEKAMSSRRKESHIKEVNNSIKETYSLGIQHDNASHRMAMVASTLKYIKGSMKSNLKCKQGGTDAMSTPLSPTIARQNARLIIKTERCKCSEIMFSHFCLSTNDSNKQATGY